MPIGAVPPNTTKSNALEATLDPVTHVWEFMQATSWYPGGDTFIPPGQPGYTAPVAFDLWFKFKPTSLVQANYYSTIGCTVWNMGDRLNYDPDETSGSKVTVEDANGLNPVTGMRIQYYTNLNKDNFYYFKVVTPAPTTVPVTNMKIRVELFHRTASQLGAITVQDRHYNGAVVVLNKKFIGSFISGTEAAHIWTGETGHSIGGQAGDVLPMSGITCIQDDLIKGVTLRSNLYKDLVSFPLNGVPVQIKRDSHGSQFWFSYYILDGGQPYATARIGTIIIGPGGTSEATLGPVYAPAGVGNANRASTIGVYNNTILYYSLYDDIGNGRHGGDILRWNIQTNSAMPVFYNWSQNSATYLGRVTDILVLINGDVIVGFLREVPMGNFNGNYQYVMRRFNSAGTIISSFEADQELGPVPHASLAYGETSEYIYLWKHAFPTGGTNDNLSTFVKFRTSNNTQVQTYSADEFFNQALLKERSLYAGLFGTGPQPPETPWGTDRGYIPLPSAGVYNYANFWIQPFPIPIPSVPPVIPPIDPPPVNEAVGGGLVMLDPANTVKHDVYRNKLGQLIDLPIKVTIRTAYLGD